MSDRLILDRHSKPDPGSQEVVAGDRVPSSVVLSDRETQEPLLFHKLHSFINARLVGDNNTIPGHRTTTFQPMSVQHATYRMTSPVSTGLPPEGLTQTDSDNWSFPDGREGARVVRK